MFSISIDFDEASKAWRQNKIHKGNGYFVYRCCYVHQNGSICKKPSLSQIVHSCKQHFYRMNKPNKKVKNIDNSI